MRYTAVIEGERIEIELTRTGEATIEAEISGRKYTVEARMVEPGVYWFDWNNRSLEIAVAQSGGGEYVVSLPDRRVSVEMADAGNALQRAAQHGHDGLAEVRVPMPGKVVKVLVAEGGEVDANQALLVMEAMKMQHEIKSPKKGIVRKLGVSEGAAVSAGDLLAVVE